MTTVFTGTPKHQGIRGDYARAVEIDGQVRIRVADTMAEEAVTIAMTPAQARDLAQGIIAAADKAEAWE